MSITPMMRASQHTSVRAILQHFTWKHLPEHLQAVSRPFGELAQQLARDLPADPEATVALRKLLEAKDAAVRAAVVDAQQTEAPARP